MGKVQDQTLAQEYRQSLIGGMRPDQTIGGAYYTTNSAPSMSNSFTAASLTGGK